MLLKLTGPNSTCEGNNESPINQSGLTFLIFYDENKKKKLQRFNEGECRDNYRSSVACREGGPHNEGSQGGLLPLVQTHFQITIKQNKKHIYKTLQIRF